ncbi:MAG: acetyl-CoA carboxylase biotin carboxyl carrier protein subunit [Chloroflexi bacterium HGW-Chloroflexi-1]|nr:MAG: acetyl-CoA carboxylase biotin carboxyl carrier protein subunit [Chloroflexi bacterium HGW-Chloroflexi-1]
MPTFDVIIQGKTYHVEIPDPGASAPAPAELPRRPRVPVARPAVPVSGNDGDEVRAPMPGTILSIEAAVGQAVDSGQVLCTLEAMKMKNPIRAIRAGTVATIAVQVGQTVAYGDLLVTLA